MYKCNIIFTFILGLLLISFVPGFALAGNGSGCGLGKMIFGGQTGMMPHLSAATTNFSSYSQSFGITSGTSGCDAENAVVNNDVKKTDFIVNNMEQLMNDISRGQGEYLTAYSQLLGCSNEFMPVFFVSMQENYVAVVTDGMSATDVLTNTKIIINQHPQLQHACSAS